MSSILDFISDNFAAIISIVVITGFIRSSVNRKEDEKQTETESNHSKKDSSQKPRYQKTQTAQTKSNKRDIDAVYPVRNRKRNVKDSQKRKQKTQQLESPNLTLSGKQRPSQDSFKSSMQKQASASPHQVNTELQAASVEIEQLAEPKTSFLDELNQEERHQRFREAIIMKEIIDSPKAIKKMNKRKYIR